MTSPAQRARTVLAQASSVRIGFADGEPVETACRAADLDGALLFAPEPRHAERLRASIDGGRPRVVAVAVAVDVAVVPTPDRVRGVLTLGGGVHEVVHGLDRCHQLLAGADQDVQPALPEPDRVLRLAPSDITLDWRCEQPPGYAQDPVAVDPVDYRRAAPDPLAGLEEAWLAHLDQQHPEELAALAGWADPDAADGARVRPLAMDRHGLVLRLHRWGSHRDLRLSFDQPASCGCQANAALNALFARTVPDAASGAGGSCER